MSKWAILLIIPILFQLSCNSKEPIFRYVSLNSRFGTINLEDKKIDLNNLINETDDRFFLRPEVFGGVSSIELIFNENKILQEIIFKYNNNITKELKISHYSSILGIPKIKNGVATWSDKHTNFTIFEKNGLIHSKLSDK